MKCSVMTASIVLLTTLVWLTKPPLSNAQAPVLVDSLEHELSKADNFEDRTYWLNRLTWVHLVNDPDKAREYNLRSRELAIAEGDSLALARTLHYEGIQHRLAGEFHDAKDRLSEAMAVFDRHNNLKGSIGALYNLALVNGSLGNFEVSLDHLHRYYALNEELGDTLQMADALNSMASVHRQTGNYEKALSRYQESLDLLSGSDHLWNITNALSNLGNLHLETGQTLDAEPYIRQSISNSRLLDDKWGLSFDLFNLGRLLVKNEKKDSALIVLNESLELRKDLGLKAEVAETLIEIGRVNTELNNFVAAQKAFLVADSFVKETGSIEPKIAIEHAKYSMFVRQNDFKSAIDHLDRYWTLRDSAKALERSKSIDALELKFESEKKDRELASKEFELLKSRTAVERQSQVLIGLTGGAIAFTIIALVVILNLRTRKRLTQEKLSNLTQKRNFEDLKALMAGEEKERARIARELHDGIGAELATVRMRFDRLQAHQVVESNRNEYNQALKQMADVSSELHRIAQNLMPELLIKFGLSTAISEFVSGVNAVSDLKIKLVIIGLNERLSPEFELAIYRIIQELISNVLKHSKATEVIVQISQRENALSITVEDNGKGFDTSNADQRFGLGLDNLSQRVRLYNGKLNIESNPQSGTSVFIEYDLNSLNQLL